MLNPFCTKFASVNGAIQRDTHIILFKVPIMLCSNSQHQANYAHCSVPIMLSVYSIFADDNSLGNLLFMIALFHSMTTHVSVLDI